MEVCENLAFKFVLQFEKLLVKLFSFLGFLGLAFFEYVRLLGARKQAPVTLAGDKRIFKYALLCKRKIDLYTFWVIYRLNYFYIYSIHYLINYFSDSIKYAVVYKRKIELCRLSLGSNYAKNKHLSPLPTEHTYIQKSEQSTNHLGGNQ